MVPASNGGLGTETKMKTVTRWSFGNQFLDIPPV